MTWPRRSPTSRAGASSSRTTTCPTSRPSTTSPRWVARRRRGSWTPTATSSASTSAPGADRVLAWQRSRCAVVALRNDSTMQFRGESVDLPGQLGVGLELELGLDEVVVGLGLLEGRLTVLSDQDERREEDRLEGDDEGERRPGTALGEQHPQGERDGVEVDEQHRPRERSDRIGHPDLEVVRSLCAHGGGDWVPAGLRCGAGCHGTQYAPAGRYAVTASFRGVRRCSA